MIKIYSHIDEETNKENLKIFKLKYINECKKALFGNNIKWLHHIIFFYKSFKEADFKKTFLNIFKVVNEPQDFRFKVVNPYEKLLKKKITEKTELNFIPHLEKKPGALSLEISIMTRYAIYAAFTTFFTMIYFWNEAMGSFLDFVFKNHELSPRFWVSGFTKPIQDKVKFCLYLTVPFLWMIIMQLGLIFVGPGLWLFEKKKVFTIIFINIFVFLFTFLLVTYFLYPATVVIFTEIFFPDPNYDIFEYRAMQEALKGYYADLQPSYEDLIGPYYKMLMICWCVLAMPINAIIFLFLKMKRTMDFNPAKIKRPLSWSILGMSSAFISPPDLPYQVLLTSYFIIVYEGTLSLLFIIGEFIHLLY